MDFARPDALWLLALLPVLTLAVGLGTRRRWRGWRALGQSGRLRGEGAWGWLLALACLAVALAQPRWGRGSGPPLAPGHDVVILVDTSRSMGAEDAVPSRLGVAVEAARSLVEALGREPGNRVAVVAFAGRGRRRCPLTENLGAAAEALAELRPGDIQPGGTDLGAGIEAALEAFDTQDHAEGRTIVLFSDGEDHTATWSSYLDLLADAGIVVHSVAIGDADQAHGVPSGRGSNPLTFEGAPVKSRREDRATSALAGATGGAFVPLGLASADLGRLYRTRIAPVARQKREAVHPSEKTERYSLFVAAALGFGLWGSRSRRGRWLGPRRWLLMCAVAALGAAAGDDDAADAVVARGRAAYAEGEYAEALRLFERAIALDPGAAVARFNAGSALYRLERYPDAMVRYQEARDRAVVSLRPKVDYALGNTALALGDVPAALDHYDACLASTARGSAVNAVRRDAAINRRFAERQARQPTVPPDEEGSQASTPNRSRDQDPADDRQDQAEERAGKGGDANAGQDPGDRSSTARRGPGGAGQSGPAPPRAGSPEARLASALNNIREARSRRIEEAPPAANDRARDW